MVQHDNGEPREHGDHPTGHHGHGAPHPPYRAAPDTGQPPTADDTDGARTARIVQLVTGDYLLTVNPVDGSEIEPCPPGELPAGPRKIPASERPAPTPVAVPGATWGLPVPLLERDEERDRLGRLLSHGRSVRLTGPAGSGRTALLDAVATDAAGLAPDGVIRLSGRHRTPNDLLNEVYAATHHTPPHRPGPAHLSEALPTVGAIVILDDLEFGGAALDELLRHTPECAFLLAATPDIAPPSPGSRLEEVHLSGLSRTACVDLLEHAVRRPLTDTETDWAADLWFETEGLPFRFLQAATLLRQYDSAHTVLPAGTGPSAQGLSALAAAGLSGPAREILGFALALDGHLPHHTHLPALTGDATAEEALVELAHTGLLTATGNTLRLAPQTTDELTAAGHADTTGARAHLAAQHYAWWAGHPSVPPESVGAEADTVLAAVRGAQRAGQHHAAVLLARTAAPVLAVALRWSAWERVLNAGQDAARTAGEVTEEVYFHHELGVLAISTGNPERARAELEAAIGLRGAHSDQRGGVAGRRALALVADLLTASGAGPSTPPGGPTPSGQSQASGATAPPGPAGTEESSSPPGGVPTPPAREADTLVSQATTASPRDSADPGPAAAPGRGSVRRGARRNLVAAGAGALLAAALGTLVTLGYASSDDDGPAETVRPEQSVSEEENDDGLPAEEPSTDRRTPSTRPTESGSPDDPTSSTPPSTGPTTPDDPPTTPDDPTTTPDDPTTTPDDPTTTPDDPTTTPDDPTTTPDDPTTTPDDPTTSPDDPPPPEEDDPATDRTTVGTRGPAASA
ncbi:ATP-binding protein [Streptomyces sp. AJS327]|uniref:ATP-binding protein n=1 Tax=Streptomyces sp. AJS327 TaxID=2545265 RepID=UPI0015DFD356|nr:ATP-binding protein [Streptomyces sp. AJS327]MBA0051608.1 ATP-binding protein [Streptomyces sp. AJS327]